MPEDTRLPFALPAVQRKKLTVSFDGGNQSSDGGLLLLREAERRLGIAKRLAAALRDRRDPMRIRHPLEQMMKTRVFVIACGHEDGNDLDRLREDPLLKLAVGRCPDSGAPLCSQSTMSRLENMPTKIEAARLTAAVRAAVPKTSPLARAEFATIRLRLIKIAARVVEYGARIRVVLPGSCPEWAVFAAVATRLRPVAT